MSKRQKVKIHLTDSLLEYKKSQNKEAVISNLEKAFAISQDDVHYYDVARLASELNIKLDDEYNHIYKNMEREYFCKYLSTPENDIDRLSGLSIHLCVINQKPEKIDTEKYYDLGQNTKKTIYHDWLYAIPHAIEGIKIEKNITFENPSSGDDRLNINLSMKFDTKTKIPVRRFDLISYQSYNPNLYKNVFDKSIDHFFINHKDIKKHFINRINNYLDKFTKILLLFCKDRRIFYEISELVISIKGLIPIFWLEITGGKNTIYRRIINYQFHPWRYYLTTKCKINGNLERLSQISNPNQQHFKGLWSYKDHIKISIADYSVIPIEEIYHRKSLENSSDKKCSNCGKVVSKDAFRCECGTIIDD